MSDLLYERFVYDNNVGNSLTRFKQSNGFVRMDLPRYFVPLNRRGTMYLSLGLHRDQRERIPQRLRRRFLDIRGKVYARRMGGDRQRAEVDGRGAV